MTNCDHSESKQGLVKQRIMLGIGANFIAVLLALVNPAFSLVLYVLFPFIYLRPSHIDRHWTHSH